MTNHWADIANTTLVLAWGANPAENHPACIAHVGRARFPKDFFPVGDTRRDKKAAQLIVVDPRKTRTASLCNELDTSKPAGERDRYIRIRPGTDIALANGLIRYMTGKIEGTPGAVQDGFFAHLNQNAPGTFYTDGSNTAATAIVDEAVTLTGVVASALAHQSIGGTITVKDAPGGTVIAAAQYALNNGAGTIARTATSTIASGATVYVSYSFGGYAALDTAVPDSSKYTDARFLVNGNRDDYQRATLFPGTERQLTGFPVKAATATASPDTVYSQLKTHCDPYTLPVVADICGCTEEEITFLGDALIANSKCSNGVNANGTPSVTDARNANFRASTILYAMGITQHTCGAQSIKAFAVLQTLLGNMGRQGGGINALRGIHNVQGSTDMGLLYGNIPAYSANPTLQVDGGPVWGTTPSTNNAFGKYMDNLWGNPLSGTGNKTQMNDSYDDAYTAAAMGLQQRGFYNMTLKWFGDYTSVNGLSGTAKRAAVDALYSLWPKGQGHDHVTMFRNMDTGGLTKAAVVWGQNPAVTEPNQGAVRAGLYNLNTLVCVDIFENETHSVKRKPGSVTYLIPSAATCEKAGSATNSGRTLQWRYQATLPSGNSKDDNELLLRFAKALDTAGAFSHIKAVWDSNGIAYDSAATTPVYKQLYQLPYGGFAGTGYNALQGTGERVNPRTHVSDPVTYENGGGVITAANNLKGSEWVAETVYREFCSPVAVGGTMWIYTGAYNAEATSTTGGPWATANIPAAYGSWAVMNRAKSRDRQDPAGQLMSHGWGYSWLVNRRVFYNNGDVPGDVADFFMGADSVSRLFVATAPPALVKYSRWYRTYHKLADKPSPVLAGNSTSPHYAGAAISLAGKFPAHTEPYETPRQDLSAADKWGRNTKNTGAWDLVKDDGKTKVAGRGSVGDPLASTYPLVLTTIRCVEHFQGGPITRNNALNVELEPVPWIEINSVDARANGIVDGDWIRVLTARNDGINVDTVIGPMGDGFKARVGVGQASNQRVGAGVVAIPWHWGEKGLSTGSRANDMCIDAADANTVIPEYKACLCRIEKM